MILTKNSGPLLAAVLTLTACAPGLSQQIEVPRTGAVFKPNDPAAKVFDPSHLKDRPYGGTLPAPAFPSTERVQRSFTVAYVYDYAFSSYTPAPDLPVIARGQVKRDNPEDAAIALFSAQRSGDWDAMLQCWTEADRKRIEAMVKVPGMSVATIQAKWKQVYSGVKVQLVDRIETAGYVILDVRVGTSQMPAIFKLVDGQWLATNDLGNTANPVLASLRPGIAGIVLHVQPVPVAELVLGRQKEAEAQREFLEGHGTRSEVVRTGQ